MQTSKPEDRDEVVRRADQVLAEHAGAQSPLYDAYRDLAADYATLLHRLNKIITISDKYQIQLKETTQQLNDAMEHVNQLRKLILPICMYCKKIRTDGDYWQQIEHYFHQHIDVMFSHGICPECLREKRFMQPGKKPG